MSDGESGKSYKFETDAQTLNEINAIEARFGMTHEEFVSTAAEFIDRRESDFRRFSSGENR